MFASVIMRCLHGWPFRACFRGLRVNCLRGVESLPRRNLRVSSVSVLVGV